jgi:hypothetical protein
MQAPELVRGIVFGSVLIILGLVPGLFHWFHHRLREEMQNFSDSLRFPFSSVGVQHKTDDDNNSRSLGVASLGLAMILLGLLSYLSNLSG